MHTDNYMAKFGRGGVVLRARASETLALDEIRARVPSVFAEQAHSSRSEKYSYIPTHQLLVDMQKEGFLPVEVRQGGTRDDEKRAYTKHLIRFRQAGVSPVVGDTFPELAMGNAHDGTSAYWLMSGWFRLACLNGLTTCESVGPSIKVPHRGNVGDIIEASYKVVEAFPEQGRAITEMSRLQLTGPEQVAYATAAASLRWDEEHTVQPAAILQARRREDVGNDTWSTFQRVQENLTKAGRVRVTSKSAAGYQQRRRARDVNGIEENVRLNRALWALTEQMRAIKAGEVS